jgi:hypothetical protein
MYKLIRFAFFLLPGLISCTATDQNHRAFSLGKNIKFNHLYFVIDSTTYHYLSDSVPFLKDFSSVKESVTDTKEESWSGKYLYGKGHYLEIFGPSGFPGAKQGDVGLGFMTNKTGTLDSLHRHWLSTRDSVDRKVKTILEDGVNYPWFTALALPDPDSLRLRTFLMENDKADMLYWGFTEKDLENEIEYWDYMRHYRAKVAKTSPDSIKFAKLFEKIRKIHLVLSDKELTLLRSHLIDFGFSENGDTFYGQDVDITYKIDSKEHFMLHQIDFKLTRSVPRKETTLKNLVISAEGQNAYFKFLY